MPTVDKPVSTVDIPDKSVSLSSLKAIDDYLRNNPTTKDRVSASPDYTAQADETTKKFIFTLVADSINGGLTGWKFSLVPDPGFYSRDPIYRLYTVELGQKDIAPSVMPRYKMDPNVHKFASELTLMTDYDRIHDDTILTAKTYLSKRAPVMLAIFESLVQMKSDVFYQLTRTPCDTLCVCYHPELKKYMYVVNTKFLMEAAIIEYFNNKSSYSNFVSAYIYILIFMWCHEVSHILKVHTVDEDILMKDIDHEIANRVQDAFINIEVSNILNIPELVTRPTYLSVGIVNEDIYNGYVPARLLKSTASDVAESMQKILSKYMTLKVLSSTGQATKKLNFKEGSIVLKCEYPISSVASVFGDKSVLFTKCIHEIITLLVNDPRRLKKAPPLFQKLLDDLSLLDALLNHISGQSIMSGNPSLISLGQEIFGISEQIPDIRGRLMAHVDDDSEVTKISKEVKDLADKVPGLMERIVAARAEIKGDVVA